MRSPSTCLALVLFAGCSANSVSVDLVFPDKDGPAATTGIVVTAIEPLGPGEDGF